MFLRPLTFALSLFLALQCLAQAELPVAIPADHEYLHYVGRFDTRDPRAPRFQWSASTLKFAFNGSDAQVVLTENGDNYYEIVLDGLKPVTYHANKGRNVIPVATGLPKDDHHVTITKRTEAHVGIGQFNGVLLGEGCNLIESKRPVRRIEVVGDSITCGYGNEGLKADEKYLNSTENAYMTYGAIAARELNAEYLCVAWSGKKMWPDNSIPEIYDLTLPFEKDLTWDFSKWQADVVVINLATNDFGRGAPDEQGWVDGYQAFLKRVRKNYPNAMIYMATGSMMSDNWPPDVKHLTTLKRYLNRIQSEMTSEGETRLKQVHFDTQDMADGIGSDWHPSIKTNEKMAARLVQAIRTDLKW